MPVELNSTESARLPESRGTGQSADLLQFVSFRLGTEEYGMDILHVQEIIRSVELTRVPNPPKFIEGVINLRGKVIPIVGLRKRFGLDQRERDKETRIIVVEVKGEVVGFEVDSVSEVLRIRPDIVEPPPRLSRSQNEYISGVGKLEGRLLLLLDVNRLMAETETGKQSPSAAASSDPIKEKEEVLVS